MRSLLGKMVDTYRAHSEERKAAEARQMLAAAGPVKLREILTAAGAQLDRDDHLFRPHVKTHRELSSFTTDQIIQEVDKLVESNGLADAIINKPIHAMAHAGMSFEAEDPIVQGFIDDWWGESGDGFQDNFWDLYRSYLQDGELILPVGIKEANGDVAFAMIDPFNVEEVKADRGNALVKDAVILKSDAAGQSRAFSIIRRIEGTLQGDTFFFSMNAPVNSTRGRSVLKTVTDKLNQYDDFLYAGAEGGAVRNSFTYHFHGDNWSEEAQKQFREDYFPGGAPPENGQVITSSGTGFKAEALSPNLQGQDFGSYAKVLRNDILGAIGMFGALFGFGEDINVATMREQMRPVVWLLGWYQRKASAVLSMMIKFKLEQAAKAGMHTELGMIRPGLDMKFKVKPGEVFPKDMVSNATILSQMTAAINLAQTSGLIGTGKSREMFVWALNAIGFETNVDEIEEDLKNDAEDDVSDLVVTPGGIEDPDDVPADGPTNSELMTAAAKIYDAARTQKLRAGLSGTKNGK